MSPAGALLLLFIRLFASEKSLTMILQSTREQSCFADALTGSGNKDRPAARSTASTGTTKFLRGTSLGTGVLGMTKAPRPIHFSCCRLPARPRGVRAGGWGAPLDDEEGRRPWTLPADGRPTPNTTLAKWVGTETDGGLPMTLYRDAMEVDERSQTTKSGSS